MKIVPILAIKKIKNSHSYQSSSPSPYSTSCQTLRSHSTKIIYCGSTKFNPPLSLSWNYSNDTRHSGKFKSATPSPESLPTAHALISLNAFEDDCYKIICRVLFKPYQNVYLRNQVAAPCGFIKIIFYE